MVTPNTHLRLVEEVDVDTAVDRGVIAPEQRSAILAIARERRQALGTADEEQLRLITSFNDIFVTLAIGVLLFAVAALVASLSDWSAGPTALGALAPLSVAALSWGLAEYFTRTRRMALPSIVLLLTFVLGSFGFAVLAGSALVGAGGQLAGDEAFIGWVLAGAGAFAAAAAFAHWRRFHVPITIAAGAAALVALLYGLVRAVFPTVEGLELVLAAFAGIGVFLVAMRFDMSDPRRETRRTDVAFWLHLLAAPLIVHPLMSWLGLFTASPSPAIAGVVIALYLIFTLVALVIDRRALLVSALAYVIYAINALLQRGGETDLQLPLTALFIGLFLVSLSAVWHRARAAAVTLLPAGLAGRLPVTVH